MKLCYNMFMSTLALGLYKYMQLPLYNTHTYSVYALCTLNHTHTHSHTHTLTQFPLSPEDPPRPSRSSRQTWDRVESPPPSSAHFRRPSRPRSLYGDDSDNNSGTEDVRHYTNPPITSSKKNKVSSAHTCVSSTELLAVIMFPA